MSNILYYKLIVILLLLNLNFLMAQPNYINWESKIIAKDYNEKQIYFNKLLHTSDGSVFSSLCNAKNNFTLAKFSLNGNLIWYYKRSDKFIDSNFIERLNSNNIVLKEFEKDYYTLITTKYLSSPTSYGDLIQNFTINATGKNAIELIVDKKDMIETSICLLSEDRDSIVSASVINYFSGNNKPLFNKINRFGKIINRVEVGELQDKYSSPLAIGKVEEFYVTANTPSFSLFQNENDLVIRFYDKNFIQVIDKKISPQILDLNNKFILVSKLIVQDNKIYIIGNSKDSKSIKRGFLIILDSKGELISKATFSSNSSFNSFLVGQDYVHIVGNITNDSNWSKFLYVKYSLNNGANSEYIWGSNSNSNNLNDVVVDNSNNLIVAGSEENNGYIAGLNQSITSIPEESSNEILFQLEVSSLSLEIKSNQFIENQNADIINIIGSSQKVEIVNNRIDISSFTSGFYLLKFQIGSDFKIVKFLILK